METLPTWIGVAGGTIAGIITIIFAAVKAWDKGFVQTEKVKTNATVDLVNLLERTINTLKAEMVEMQRQHLENSKELGRLKGENETLTRIFQGRDEQQIKFQQEGLAAFKRVELMANSMDKLVISLEGHFGRVEEMMAAANAPKKRRK